MRFLVIMLTLIFANSAMAAPSKKELPEPIRSYEDGLINAFQVACTVGPLNFDRLSSYAAAIGMKKSVDTTEPESSDATRHVQSWEGSLTKGPWTLLIEKIESPSVRADTCGVAANVDDKAKYHNNIISRLHLKGNGEQHDFPNGNQITYWKKAYGAADTIVSITDVAGGSGVIIQILSTKISKPVSSFLPNKPSENKVLRDIDTNKFQSLKD